MLIDSALDALMDSPYKVRLYDQPGKQVIPCYLKATIKVATAGKRCLIIRAALVASVKES